jgi:alkylation response protein AidB-like acyl-CoA dehydrogenase
MYANGPDVILAGAVQPSGTAEKISKGWLVKGRWPLASGARHAQWLLGMCIMTEDGKSLPNPRSGAAPWARFFALPASQWNIEDTWYSLGLRGTGSTHVSLSGTVVPEKNFFDLGGKPSVEGPLYSYPQVLIPTFHAAVHLGIAEGAIDDLVEIVKAKVSGPGALTKDSELFNAELGRISTDATAARTVMRATAKELWRDIERSNSNAAELASRAVQMAVWTSNLCDEITDRCYVLSGSQSIYDGSSLQRRLRDSKTASQHAAIRATKYIDIGKARLSTAQAVSPGEA